MALMLLQRSDCNGGLGSQSRFHCLVPMKVLGTEACALLSLFLDSDILNCIFDFNKTS